MMKIISGTAKGIQLDAPKGLSVRPTGVMARKSLFDSLRFFDGLTILDLFAGTGALGLEAASRGAASVYFVDNSALNCKIINGNIEKVRKTGVAAEMQVINADVLGIAGRAGFLSGRIDIIFADPPYDKADYYAGKLLNDKAFSEFAGGAMFIFETPSESSRKPDFDKVDLWSINDRRKLGQSTFYFLRTNAGKAEL